MSVSSSDSAIKFNGNASAVTAYALPFQFLTAASIKAVVTTFTGLGIVDAQTAGLGYVDYDITLSEGMDSGDLPESGDQVRDDDENLGTVVGVTDNEDGTCTVRVSSKDPFGPANATSVELVLPDLLDASEYTVTQNDNGTGSVVTDVAVAADKEILLYRDTPLVQPAEFPNAGPFPAATNETAFDRIEMQVQEMSRRVGLLEGGARDSILVVPAGDSTSVKGIKLFANAAARGAASAEYTGQLGVQLDNHTLWTASSTAAGAWVTKTFQLEYAIYADDAIIPASDTGVFAGYLAKAVYVKSWSVYFVDGATDNTAVTLLAGIVNMGTISGLTGSITSETTDFPSTLVPAGTLLSVNVTCPDYSGILKGLRIILHCEHGS